MLKESIIEANKAYRSGRPTISDEEFDILLEKFRLKVSASEYDSFVQTLMEEPGNMKHPYIIGSLKKVKYNEKDTLCKWLKSYITQKILVMPKIDGMSFVSHYKNGKLICGTTRGDGYKGENITDKLLFILPKTIKSKEDLWLRGELFMEGEDYIELGLKNRRNGTVGTMGKKDIEKDKLNYIKASFYQILNTEDTAEIQLNTLKTLGLPTVTYDIIKIQKDNDTNIENIKNLFNKIKTSVNYDIDGLVICPTEAKNENEYYPKAKVAFKMQAEADTTEVIGIEWETSRMGLLKPVLLLKPVEIAGVTISRVTAYNAKYVSDNILGKGAVISIIRSGDVIPKIVDVLKKASKVELPNVCPECGGKIILDSVDLKCIKNGACQEVKQVAHLFKKLEIEGASEVSLSKFGLDTFDRLFTWLPENSSKNQVKVYDEMKHKLFNFGNFDETLVKMPFSGAGETNMTKLIEEYGSKKLYEMVKTNKLPTSFPQGLGEQSYKKAVSDYVKYYEITERIMKDNRKDKVTMKVTNKSKNKLDNLSFVITGTLSKKRSEFEKIIKDNGGIVSGSVSKTTNYLLAGEDCGSKLDKASKLGINIIDEEKFNRMIE